jgi:hypothetical protein
MTDSRIRRALVVAALILSGACASTHGSPTENAMEYLETLQRHEANGIPFSVGDSQKSAALERFQSLLSDFKAPGFREQAELVYADDAFFNDTLKTVRGSEAIAEYLAKSGDALETGTVDFLDVVASNGNYYLRWKMTLQFKSFAKGQRTTTVGMSHIRFNADGRVVLHQDFWDSSGGLFEHLPGLGWMIRRVKSRL